MFQVLEGDCLEVLKTMPDCSVDAVITDPPYGLSQHTPEQVKDCLLAWCKGEVYQPKGKGFMGKKWDAWVPGPEVWKEVLRVLKPGGHALVFAGTRSMDLMSMSLRLAGFELRDSIGHAYDDSDSGAAPLLAWVHGQGFPKNLDIGKAIDKLHGAEREVVGIKSDPRYLSPRRSGFDRGVSNYLSSDGSPDHPAAQLTKPATPEAEKWDGFGTAIKPSWEPILLCRKPLEGTVAENVLKHGTGGLNIGACRIGTDEKIPARHGTNGAAGHTMGARNEYIPGSAGTIFNTAGRWPANVVLTCSCDGAEHSESCPVSQFPETKSGIRLPNGNKFYGRNSLLESKTCDSSIRGFDDSGSAARFFYCARQDVSTPEVCYNEAWQDQNLNQSSALTAGQNLSLLKAVGSIVQKAVATWQSLEGILSNAQSGAFTSVTQSELKTINEVVTATIATIGSGFLHRQQLEKLTQCGSRVKCAAMKEPRGITTITTSLCKSDGCVAVVTSTITQTNLGHGVAASRFNYTAKASKRDRDEGLENLPKTVTDDGRNKSIDNPYQRGETLRHNPHPTVKATPLMRWLCRLICPPSAVILDPFCGSGSTGKAAVLEGFDFIGIEQDSESVQVARARIAYVAANPEDDLSPAPLPQATVLQPQQLSLGF